MLNAGMVYRDWLACYDGTREAAASLVGARAHEIALTKNTSEGLSFIANGLDWRSGDIAVGVREDFPANVFPWTRLGPSGVKLRWLELRDGQLDYDEIDRACEGARLLAVSFVHYLTGFRLDLERVGEICKRRGCLFVVDAVQGLGPFKVDVGRAGVHALSASAHKWLLGPEGSAFLFVADELGEQVEPIEFGWTNVTGFPEFSREENVRPDAGRFECGTLNTVGYYGLRESLGLFLEAGVERIQDKVDGLAQSVLEKCQEKGYEAATVRAPENGSGIVSVRKAGVDAASVVAGLADKRMSVSTRHGWIRASPHFYNTEEEVDQLVELLP